MIHFCHPWPQNFTNFTAPEPYLSFFHVKRNRMTVWLDLHGTSARDAWDKKVLLFVFRYENETYETRTWRAVCFEFLKATYDVILLACKTCVYVIKNTIEIWTKNSLLAHRAYCSGFFLWVLDSTDSTRLTRPRQGPYLSPKGLWPLEMPRASSSGSLVSIQGKWMAMSGTWRALLRASSWKYVY